MTAAPISAVPATTLSGLLASHSGLARKRVTVLYRAHCPAKAAAVADRDVRTAKGKAESRKGVVKADQTRALQMATQTAAEQASGAGLVRFAMLVTATISDQQELSAAEHVVDQLAATSRIRLQKATGTQAPSFAAGLGIGLVLNSEVAIPAFLRENL